MEFLNVPGNVARARAVNEAQDERPEDLTGGRFRHGVVATICIQAIILLVAMAQGAIVARTLGPDGKGILAVALLAPSLLAQILGGGISISTIYFAGSRTIGIPVLVGHSVTFALVGTLAGAGLIGLVLWIMPTGSAILGVPLDLLLLGSIGVPLLILTRSFVGILHGQRRILTVNALQLLSVAVTLCLTYLFLAMANGGEANVVTAWLLGLIAMALVTAILLRKEGGTLRPGWDSKTAAKLISFGARSQIASLFYHFALRLDIFLLSYFLGPAEVGIYSVSVRLAELLWHLPTAVSFVIIPMAARSSTKQMNSFTPRVLRWTLGLTLLGALALAIVGRPLIRLVFSEAFTAAYVPLLLLLPGVVLMGGVQILFNEIIGRGFPQFSSLIAGFSLVLILVLDLLMIPRYGMAGAAVASTATYSISFIFGLIIYRKVSRRPGTGGYYDPRATPSVLTPEAPNPGT